MVRRLVEDEHVGPPDQQRGERDPTPLATRHRARPVASRPSSGIPSPDRTVRTPASPAHSCSAANAAGSHASPTTTSRTVASGQLERLRQRGTADRGGGLPGRVGLLLPVSSRSSVDFPAPLSPTTPTRSASSRPSETSVSSRPAAPYDLLTLSRLRMFATPRGYADQISRVPAPVPSAVWTEWHTR